MQIFGIIRAGKGKSLSLVAEGIEKGREFRALIRSTLSASQGAVFGINIIVTYNRFAYDF